jgi:hypothetical protein
VDTLNVFGEKGYFRLAIVVQLEAAHLDFDRSSTFRSYPLSVLGSNMAGIEEGDSDIRMSFLLTLFRIFQHELGYGIYQD